MISANQFSFVNSNWTRNLRWSHLTSPRRQKEGSCSRREFPSEGIIMERNQFFFFGGGWIFKNDWIDDLWWSVGNFWFFYWIIHDYPVILDLLVLLYVQPTSEDGSYGISCLIARWEWKLAMSSLRQRELPSSKWLQPLCCTEATLGRPTPRNSVRKVGEETSYPLVNIQKTPESYVFFLGVLTGKSTINGNFQ